MASRDKGGKQDVATMGYVKRLVRKKLRRQPEHEEQFLNIYPMMDMMTILVVFLLMQFASSSAASLQETDKLQIPYSTSREDLVEALPVVVAYNVILVEDEPVLELREGGVIDASHMRGGANSFLVLPLLKKLEEKAKRGKFYAEALKKKGAAAAKNAQESAETVLLTIDERIPYSTVSRVIYTLGSAGFKNVRFVVDTKKSVTKKKKKE